MILDQTIDEVYGEGYTQARPNDRDRCGDVYMKRGKEMIRVFCLQDYTKDDPVLKEERDRPPTQSDVLLTSNVTLKLDGNLQVDGSIPSSFSPKVKAELSMAYGEYAFVFANKTLHYEISSQNAYILSAYQYIKDEKLDNQCEGFYVVLGVVRAEEGVNKSGKSCKCKQKIEIDLPAGQAPVSAKAELAARIAAASSSEVGINFMIAKCFKKFDMTQVKPHGTKLKAASARKITDVEQQVTEAIQKFNECSVATGSIQSTQIGPPIDLIELPLSDEDIELFRSHEMLNEDSPPSIQVAKKAKPDEE